MSPEVGEGPGGSPQSPVVSILVQHLMITRQRSTDQVPLEPLVMLFRNNNNSSLDWKKKGTYVIFKRLIFLPRKYTANL